MDDEIKQAGLKIQPRLFYPPSHPNFAKNLEQ